MIKCFLIPMTDPPYSKESPQMPKYVDKFKNGRTNSPLFDTKYFVVKIAAKPSDLVALQAEDGVIDFPNIDLDKHEDLPIERQGKNFLISQEVGIEINPKETNRDFINRCARANGNFDWDKDKLLVHDIY